MKKNPMTREKMSALDEWWDNRVEIKDEKEDHYSLNFCGYPNEEKLILSPKETIENFKVERERLDQKMDAKLQEIMDMLGV